jgi:uncharacterized membrane protein YcaP (DUF421 family)
VIKYPLLNIAAHTLFIYLFLILGLRVLGRRQMGQLTVIDLVIILLLGSAVEMAMLTAVTSLSAGLVSASTLFLANRFLSFLFSRSRRLAHLVAGDPLLLVSNGRFVEEHLRRAGLTHADVLEAIRQHGYAAVEKVQFAVLELDGTITVVPPDAPTRRGGPDIRRPPATPVW